MRSLLLFTLAITLLTACGSSVASSGSSEAASSGDKGASSGSPSGGGGGGVPSGLYVEVTGSGEAPFTAPCRKQTPQTTVGNEPPILPGPADEIMVGELGACVLSACKAPGPDGARVTLDLGAIFTDKAGTYPALVSLHDDQGNTRSAKGTVTVTPSASCATYDGRVVGQVAGHYSATNLEPVVAADAGPSPLDPLPSLSGTFRVDLICEPGGA